MRVVFMGFQTWGHTTLRALIEAGHEIVLVLTHRESSHAYERIFNESVKQLAVRSSIPVLERRSANDLEIIRRITSCCADIIICSNWRTWISPDIYGIPRCGAINIHDALLPKYGGFAPINWAIINGETETGVTVHVLNEEFDLGDIVLQQRVRIGPDETASDIFHKTLPLFCTMPIEALDLIGSGRAKLTPQDPRMATFFHKRCERDSLIDWTRPSRDVFNLIRAQSDPYPNAFTYFMGNKLRIKSAILPDRCYEGTPGRLVCRTRDGVIVLCGKGAQGQGVILREVQAHGVDPISANEFFDRMGSYLGEELALRNNSPDWSLTYGAPASW